MWDSLVCKALSPQRKETHNAVVSVNKLCSKQRLLISAPPAAATMVGAGARPFVDLKLAQRKVILFSKSYVPECKEVKAVLAEFGMSPDIYEFVEIDKRQDVNQIENYFQIICLTDNRTVSILITSKK